MKRLLIVLCIVTSLTFAGCHKNNSSPGTVTSGKIDVRINYKVGTNALIFDSLVFSNEAGNQYSIEKLQYYLSDFCFYKDHQLKFTSSEVFYCDARKDTISAIELTSLTGMPVGTYDSISFYIGVDPALNISNGLPSTMENIDMGWPDAMGGGYHFLKIEGHWKDSLAISGYDMHLGSNNYQVKTGIKFDMVINPVADVTLKLVMDVNEWFRKPYTYNFHTDGAYSMGNTTLMQKLEDNGVDVFTVN